MSTSDHVEEGGTALAALALPRILGRWVRVLFPAGPREASADELPLAVRVSLGAILTLTRALRELPLDEPAPSPDERDECLPRSLGTWHDVVRRGTAWVGTAIELGEKGLRLAGGEESAGGRVLRDVLEFVRVVVREPSALLAALDGDDLHYDAV